MKIRELGLPGVFEMTPSRHGDNRGFFSETYNRAALAEAGIDDVFVQDNHSLSAEQGTLRGMHFQTPPHAISKLVRVVKGAVYDVVADLRRGSASYGKHVGIEISAERWNQIYVPIGFAHGFVTLEPDTEVVYKVTDFWSVDVDKGVAWDDPDLAIDWPVSPADVVLSEKDRNQPALADLPAYFTMEMGT